GGVDAGQTIDVSDATAHARRIPQARPRRLGVETAAQLLIVAPQWCSSRYVRPCRLWSTATCFTLNSGPATGASLLQQIVTVRELHFSLRRRSKRSASCSNIS